MDENQTNNNQNPLVGGDNSSEEVFPAEQPSQGLDQVPAQSENPAATQAVSETTNTSVRILLAEDEEDARSIYIDILTSAGFNPDGAENGQRTLNMLAANKYDLLLLDIIMPDMDGISVLAQIKNDPEKYGNLRVVMLTNIGGDLAIEKALSLGANGYMLKSETEPQDLIEIINKYLAGENNVKLSR